ncbi:DUF4832 domain-containing protein [Tahibacter amnicola]|uniref:DUF4832 domain-containing protein n=1 Tax=Tahibacter amnicola TaxID=2976241 RepID=A0ABY6BKC4_9GAMM|nr:DUF4832 domain-containing protein [Tahibacter amnicola]UXI70066.1 DUF4832 domain-containing protein [Tahibacter amnicola]
MRRLSALLALVMPVVAMATQYTPPVTQDDLDNPHKGFMLWGTTWSQGGAENHYGASIYHVYVPWRELETADQVFDWAGFEQRHLQPILNDDPQATFVLRPVADYPDSVGTGLSFYYTGGQPERDYPLFLEQPPLNIPAFDYTSCDGDGPGRTPDWNNAAFATQARQLIVALGQRYNGDPRITAIQVGLLGLWGEWHQTGCPTPEPNDAVKRLVRDAYVTAFPQTRLQTRYARDPDAVGVNFGFHEDYFPSFTANCTFGFPSCDDSGDWNLEYGLAHVVPAARQNWKENPVSGESPFTAQKNAWVNDTADILTVIRNYHFSFLGPAGKHEEAGFATPLNSIKRTLGYDFAVNRLVIPDVLAAGMPLAFTLEVTNRGAAPVYHGFAPQLHFVDGGGVTRGTVSLTGDLRTVLPGSTTTFTGQFSLPAIAPGSYSLRINLGATAAGQRAITLQNSPRDTSGRVTLGTVTVQAAPDRIFASGFESP